MEIKVLQEKLARALGIVSKVAMGARATLPVLANVLIKAEKNKVSLTATNLDMAVVDYVPVIDSTDGVITVPARILAEFVQNLPKSAEVTIKVEGNRVKVKAGKYSSIINGTPADDFPELPEIEEKKVVAYKMNIDEFKAYVGEVIIAASNDTTKPVLTGVAFNTVEGALYIAATDGYRMAERKFIEKVESDVAAVVPASSLQEVLRSISDDMDEIELLFDEDQVRFRMGEIEITSKLIDGTYPDYRRLIPQSSEIEVVLDKAELMRIVKIASLFARGSNRAISCAVDSKEKVFRVSSISNEVGENESEIEAEGADKDGKMRADSKFLMDALNVMDEEKVRIGFAVKGDSPVLLTNESNNKYRHIVMPLEN